MTVTHRGALDYLSKVFGVQVLGITQYCSIPEHIVLHIEGVDVVLGTIRALVDRRLLCEALAKTIHTYPKVGRNGWADVRDMLLFVMEDVKVEQGSDEQRISGWLADYLANWPAGELGDDNRHWRSGAPFRQGQDVYIALEHFRQWLGAGLGEVRTGRQIAVLLTQAGATFRKWRPAPGLTRDYRTWRLPCCDA